MSVLTEAALRILLKDADLDAMTEYRVDKDVIVTPSARAWLTDHKIDLLIGDKRVIKNPTASAEEKPAPKPEVKREAAEQGEKSALPAFEKPTRFESLDGGFFTEKPEHMTALHGNVLVKKDHPRIALRGRIDSLESKIIETQLAFRRLGLEQGVTELGEVLTYVKGILRGEVLNLPLEPMQLFGMDEQEIRRHSHTPKKFYGITHFAASVDDGEAVVLLNTLRTAVREVELAAYEAFKQSNAAPEREDIILAFNRLSSVFYVMMFRAKTGVYKNG